MSRTWVITGGARGIGKEIIKTLYKENQQVFFVDKNLEEGENLAKSLSGEKVFFYHGDMSKEETLKEFVQWILTYTQKVDVLVNNAGFSLGGLPECTYEKALEVLKVGALAPYELSRLLLPYFTPKKSSIINITSTRTFMSQKGTESYTMAKGALSGLTHSMSVSLKGKIRVNAIAPGWIETDEKASHSLADQKQHTVERVGQGKDIANAVWFLASEEAAFITGEELVVDGGMSRQMIYHGDDGWEYKP